jgi:N-acetylglucosaminyldiphosphoundecaprenol N-acetyl-beta-D-mannosaminyltransferase
MERWVEDRGQARWIAVTSSHGVVEGHKHPEFKAVLKTADLSLPDGNWTARLAGRYASCAPIQIRGADLLVSFCEISSRKGYSNFFFGETEEVLGLLITNLRKQFPTLKVAGAYSPPFRSLAPEEDARITDLINEAKPDVLWVGLGLPKQEWWIFRHRNSLKVPVIVAAGAAFKFVAGKIKPAPRWMSQRGLEWAWRLAHEPRRLWHRVVIYGPQFAALTALELAGLKKCH